MIGARPDYIEDVAPRNRAFPPSWKDAAIRSLYDDKAGGVQCQGCGVVLCGLAQLRSLEADHIYPWSRGGLTTWENMQLLCRPCNSRKSSGTV